MGAPIYREGTGGVGTKHPSRFFVIRTSGTPRKREHQSTFRRIIGKMNELFFSPLMRRGNSGRLIRRMVWEAAKSCALGGLYPGRIEKHWFRVERLDMPLPRLGAAFDGAKLVHISDVHCSLIVLERYLRQCVDAINELDVDFVAVTGDFITHGRYYARRVARILGKLSPRVATLACLGNHDYGVFFPSRLGDKHGLADYIAAELSHQDIFVMLNESRVFRRGSAAIQFVGLEDLWSSRYDVKRAFEQARRDLPTIALVHNPDAAHDAARHGADLVLAGHTHGSKLQRYMPTHTDFHAGMYPLGDNKHLYVTRGISYGRRVNVNARPEITVFTLRGDSDARR